MEDLTIEQSEIITKYLVITPEVKDQGFNKFSKHKIPTKKQPIELFQIFQYDEEYNILETEDPERTEYVHLPMTAAKRILTPEQIKKHNSWDYPKFDKKEFPYCENLREDKIANIRKGVAHLKEHFTTTLKLPPGYGKTILGCALWYSLGLRCAVLVDSIHLLKQHKQTFLQACPNMADHIWIVGDKKKPEIPLIILCMIGRVQQIDGETLRNVGVLIIDEAHKMCTPTRVKPILYFTPKYLIIETATLGKKDGAHSIVYALAGKHSIWQLPNRKHRVIIYQTGIEYEVVKNNFGPNFGDLQKKIASDKEVVKHVIKILKDNPHRKFMVMSNSTDHVEKLSAAAEKAGLEQDTMYGSKKDYSNSFVLFGTISKIGTGFDEATFCQDFAGVKSNTLILLTSMKANIPNREIPPETDLTTVFTDGEIAEIALWEQIRGRVMRSDDPCVIYFSFNHPTVKKHIRGIKPWIKLTNGEIIEHDAEEEDALIL